MALTHHYEATFSDGTKATRKSPRTYTHAIKDNCGWHSWSGSQALAMKAAQGREIAQAVAVKTTGRAD